MEKTPALERQDERRFKELFRFELVIR
jgi:hypothetical protein